MLCADFTLLLPLPFFFRGLYASNIKNYIRGNRALESVFQITLPWKIKHLILGPDIHDLNARMSMTPGGAKQKRRAKKPRVMIFSTSHRAEIAK